jgi:hypothetical protein
MGTITDRFEQGLQHWKNPSWWNPLILLPWALGGVWAVSEYCVDRRIAIREKTATGVITVHDQPNHNRYGYTFVVNGQSYAGWETPLHADPVIGQ